MDLQKPGRGISFFTHYWLNTFSAFACFAFIRVLLRFRQLKPLNVL